MSEAVSTTSDVRVLEVHREWMLRVASARLGDAHDVEDVVQEAFLSAIQVEHLPASDKLRAWLFSLVVRRCADHLRREYGERRRVEEWSVGTAMGGNDGLLLAERSESIRRYVSMLGDEAQRVLHLFYNEGLSYSEIARRTGVSERAIEYRLLRARQQLRASMRAGLDGEID